MVLIFSLMANYIYRKKGTTTGTSTQYKEKQERKKKKKQQQKRYKQTNLKTRTKTPTCTTSKTKGLLKINKEMFCPPLIEVTRKRRSLTQKQFPRGESNLIHQILNTLNLTREAPKQSNDKSRKKDSRLAEIANFHRSHLRASYHTRNARSQTTNRWVADSRWDPEKAQEASSIF